MCHNQSGNIACACTLSCFLIALVLIIMHIVYFDDRSNPYGELALYSLGIGFILWVSRVNIKTDAKSNAKSNIKIHPEF